MNICIYMYICVYNFIFICIYVYVCKYLYIYIYVHICTRICIYTHIYVHPKNSSIVWIVLQGGSLSSGILICKSLTKKSPPGVGVSFDQCVNKCMYVYIHTHVCVIVRVWTYVYMNNIERNQETHKRDTCTRKETYKRDTCIQKESYTRDTWKWKLWTTLKEHAHQKKSICTGRDLPKRLDNVSSLHINATP